MSNQKAKHLQPPAAKLNASAIIAPLINVAVIVISALLMCIPSHNLTAVPAILMICGTIISTTIYNVKTIIATKHISAPGKKASIIIQFVLTGLVTVCLGPFAIFLLGFALSCKVGFSGYYYDGCAENLWWQIPIFIAVALFVSIAAYYLLAHSGKSIK